MPSSRAELFSRFDAQKLIAKGAHSVELLHEAAEVYRGLGEGEASRLRSFLLVRVSESAQGPELLSIVAEELTTGHKPHQVAAAARVLMNIGSLRDELRVHLLAARNRFALQDRIVDLDAYPPRPGMGESTLAIVDRALQLPKAVSRGCCGSSRGRTGFAPPIASSLDGIAHVEVEDQVGRRASLGDLIRGRICLLAFFYTRCSNPLKCSRTVSLMGELDRSLIESGSTDHRVFGLTYDPEFDLPGRLRTYGADRGLAFSASCRLLRTTGSFRHVSDILGLGAGYGDSTVNMHRLEWLLVGRSGKVMRSGTRRHWDATEIHDNMVRA